MDMTTIAILFVVGLGVLGLIVWMLNRAWGDFPSRISPLTSLEQTPVRSSLWPATSPPPADDEKDVYAEDDANAILTPGELPAGAPADGLVLVTHPLLRRSIAQALAQGGNQYAPFFIRDGERIYLALYRIADPAQREMAKRVFEGVNGGNLSGIGPVEVIRMLSQLAK